MPPSPPSEHEFSIDGDQPFLTNQDVEILHLIVSSAQSLVQVHSLEHPDAEPLPTFKALFAAYDTVLEENGINPWHDQTYFRFLLRMGGWPGNTLFKKFEALLEELGIRLEFDEEGQAPQDITREFGVSDSPGAPLHVRPVSRPGSPRGRHRRASFDSVYDAEDESTYRSTRRATSESSKPRPNLDIAIVSEKRPSTRAANRAAERTQSHDRNALRAPSQHVRGRLTARDFANNINGHRTRDRSASSYGGLQVWRRGRSRDIHEQPKAHISSTQAPEPTISLDHQTLPSHSVFKPTHQLTSKLRSRPSDTQILLRAEELYDNHVVSEARRLIRKWRISALQVLQDRRNLEALATDRDVGTLLRQAFEHWRVATHAKRQLAETERFFAHLGSRADKARDLYLLTKAFTHWAQSSLDQIQRTSVARRHILRTRYFHAWRDITAVNELKVRRQILLKFIGVWKSRSARALTDNVKALSVYHENIVQKVYWRWFWAFCGIRAPQWCARKVKRKCIEKWIQSVKERREREVWIDDCHSRLLLKNSLEIWVQRSRNIRPYAQQALRFKHDKFARNALTIWRVATALSPRAAEVSNTRDWRIARTACTTWIGRMCMEREAGIVDRLRVLRNSWTSWNDFLRRQTLAAKIDERIVLQAMYRWVLAERSILLQRLLDRRSKLAVITKLMRRWGDLRDRLSSSEQEVRGNRDKLILSKAVNGWKQKLQLLKERGQPAFDLYALRYAQGAFRPWINRLQLIRQMQQWSNDANFYFLASKTVKRLQAAVVTSQRQKRRMAYGQIRRLVKKRWAEKALHFWRQRTLQISDMRNQAESINHHRAMAVAVANFDVWRDRSQDINAMLEQADTKSNRDVALRQLCAWQRELRQRQAVGAQAELLAHARISALAAVLLNKFSLLMFEIRTRQEKAESWKDWKDKKHFRGILRHWMERTAQRKGADGPQLFPNSTSLRREMDEEDEDGGLTGRAEDWTAFEDGFDLDKWRPSVEVQSNATPLPGYLRTPSKAARAKAMLKVSTTPATPRRTPFERRLRSQMSSSRSSVIRTGFGKSVFGTGQGVIEDIQEVSPRLVNGDS